MSIELMAKAVNKLNKCGFYCSTYSTPTGYCVLSIHYPHGHLVVVNSLEMESKEQFEYRLQLIAKNGLKGNRHGN